MSFISIIVPVYNAEQYIETCVESVLGQSFHDWELILVDDGSCDDSSAICERYAVRDDRIRTIRQENKGTSAARNAGVALAQGDYITFMDNDDWWLNKDALASVAEQLKKRPVDLLCHMSCRANFDGSRIDDKETTSYANKVASLSVAEAIRFIVDAGMMTSAVWTKVARKTLLERHGIIFPVGMRNEDTDWSAKVLAVCDSVAWCDERFYVYRKGHAYAQTSHKLPPSSVTDLEVILKENLALADSLDKERGDALKSFLSYPFIVWVGQAQALGFFRQKNEERQHLLMRLKEITDFSEAPRARFVSRVCRVVGVRNTARLLGWAFKRKYPQ